MLKNSLYDNTSSFPVSNLGVAPMTLEDLMRRLAECWPIDEKNYPRWKGKLPYEMRMEALKHCILHQNKALGKLSGAVEHHDHGGNLDTREAFLAVIAMTNNTLKIASLLGIEPESLIDSCVAKLGRSSRKLDIDL